MEIRSIVRVTGAPNHPAARNHPRMTAGAPAWAVVGIKGFRRAEARLPCHLASASAAASTKSTDDQPATDRGGG